jgi:hypothetical protein
VPLDPLQSRIARTALGLPQAHTLALAGGGAMIAHGFTDRPTRDVDLFTEVDPDEATQVAAALRAELEREGLRVLPADRPPHTNRFVITDPNSGSACQVEVFPDGGRLRPTVQLDIGPVLHPDDLAADKMLALWGRAEIRDYADVVALLDRYQAAALLELAAAKDTGSLRPGSPTHSMPSAASIPKTGRPPASTLTSPPTSKTSLPCGAASCTAPTDLSPSRACPQGRRPQRRRRPRLESTCRRRHRTRHDSIRMPTRRAAKMVPPHAGPSGRSQPDSAADTCGQPVHAGPGCRAPVGPSRRLRFLDRRFNGRVGDALLL